MVKVGINGFAHILILIAIAGIAMVGGYGLIKNTQLSSAPKPIEVVEDPVMVITNQPVLTLEPTPTITPIPTVKITLKPSILPTKKPTVVSPSATTLDCKQFNSSNGTATVTIKMEWNGGLEYEKKWFGIISPGGECPGNMRNGSNSGISMSPSGSTWTSPQLDPGQYRVNINYSTKSQGYGPTLGKTITLDSGNNNVTIQVAP